MGPWALQSELNLVSCTCINLYTVFDVPQTILLHCKNKWMLVIIFNGRAWRAQNFACNHRITVMLIMMLIFRKINRKRKELWLYQNFETSYSSYLTDSLFFHPLKNESTELGGVGGFKGLDPGTASCRSFRFELICCSNWEQMVIHKLSHLLSSSKSWFYEKFNYWQLFTMSVQSIVCIPL